MEIDKENWPRGVLWVDVTKTAYLLLARCSRDGGAWWAAVYGVAQSQTQLKQFSSSSSSNGSLKIQWRRISPPH